MKLRALRHAPWLISFLAMVVVPVFLMIGCEDGTDDVESYFNNNPENTGELSASTNMPYITPEEVELATDGLKAVFTAHAGRGPYEWSVGNGSLGSIRVDGNSQALYTRLRPGDNTVVIHDQFNHWAVATISQPGDSTNAVGLTASGGTPTYSLSAGKPKP